MSSTLDRRTLLGGSAGALGLLVAGSAAPFASHASAAQTTRRLRPAASRG